MKYDKLDYKFMEECSDKIRNDFHNIDDTDIRNAAHCLLLALRRIEELEKEAR